MHPTQISTDTGHPTTHGGSMSTAEIKARLATMFPDDAPAATSHRPASRESA